MGFESMTPCDLVGFSNHRATIFLGGGQRGFLDQNLSLQVNLPKKDS